MAASRRGKPSRRGTGGSFFVLLEGEIATASFFSLDRGQWQWNPRRGPSAHLYGALLHNQGRLRRGTRPGDQPQDRRRKA